MHARERANFPWNDTEKSLSVKFYANALADAVEILNEKFRAHTHTCTSQFIIAMMMKSFLSQTKSLELF